MCTINQEIDLEDLFKNFKQDDMKESMIKNNEKFFKLSEDIHNTDWKDYNHFLVYLNNFQRKNKDFFRKSILGYTYKIWCKKNNETPKQDIIKYLLKNSIRTGSGVTVITVFTSPKPTYENENGEIIRNETTKDRKSTALPITEFNAEINFFWDHSTRINLGYAYSHWNFYEIQGFGRSNFQNLSFSGPRLSLNYHF